MNEANIIPFGKRNKKIDLTSFNEGDIEGGIDILLDLAMDIENDKIHEYSVQIVYTDGKTGFGGVTTFSPGRLLKVMAESRSSILERYNSGPE